MTTFQLHQDTRAHPELASQLEGLAKRVFPVLERVTQLPLGEVTIRLQGTDDFLDRIVSGFHDSVAREADAFGLDTAEIRACRTRLEAREESLRLRWPSVPGCTVDAEGQPEILINADAVQHAGLHEAHMIKLLAHEGCRVGQHRGGEGELFRVLATTRPQYYGLLPGAQAAFIADGHALWADQQVTQELIGRVVVPGETSGHETDTLRQARARYDARIEELEQATPGAAAAAHSALTPGEYRAGAQWVGRVMQFTGVALLNWVWAYPCLLPTRAEVACPEQWTVRATATAAAVTG
ncbi:zinc-dependent metalloprotease [Streptomyces aureocirculatus]|uniref:zinc-dependent metalloprotease n=1 Tax=Streptomyces aureocirculatus TaxID=67275 RepID=UPI0004C8A59C|nr:zinc-dependent metalloprotease [Streptomyces aureocirculatus]